MLENYTENYGESWIIFLVDTISFGLAKNSNLQYIYHFIFINFVEYWQKLIIYFIVGFLTLE